MRDDDFSRNAECQEMRDRRQSSRDHGLPLCACMDRNPFHCAWIQDAILSGDDCRKRRRCECGCHEDAP